MPDQKFKVLNAIEKRLKDMGDGTHAEVVAAVIVDQNGNIPSGGADRELLPTRYTCKQAFTGAVVGDVIRQTVALDVSGATMTVISVLWENESTGAVINAPPSIANNLEAIKQGDALTLAQLLSAGLATATNQVTQIGYLADLADTNDRFATYKFVRSEDLGTGTKYILKADGNTGATKWLLIRKTYTDTSSVLGYASQTNNPTVTTPTAAWTARASLVYGDLSAA